MTSPNENPRRFGRRTAMINPHARIDYSAKPAPQPSSPDAQPPSARLPTVGVTPSRKPRVERDWDKISKKVERGRSIPLSEFAILMGVSVRLVRRNVACGNISTIAVGKYRWMTAEESIRVIRTGLADV